MRYGVLSDVHGNLFALREAVAAARRLGVEGWLCAGDLVGYGPYPNECVELVAGLGATCVAGNHDLMAVGVLSLEHEIPLVQVTQRWTQRVLGTDARSYLEGLPRTAVAPGIVMAHGSLDDPEEYVRTDTAAAAQLRRLATRDPHADLLILGHTHRWLVYEEGSGRVRVPRGRSLSLPATGRRLLNPGSVGQSRQIERVPHARFLVLDADGKEARFHRMPYDVAGCRHALRERGLPAQAIHQPRRPVKGVLRRARNVAHRTLSRS